MPSTAEIVPARRTENITYAVRDVILLAEKVAKTGREMVYLNIGDPNAFDFETPPHLIEAIYQALRANRNSYSPSSGIAEAREAVEREAERKGVKNVQDVFITTGASEAIELCLTALLNEGDNLLTPFPGYPLYTAILAKLGAAENPYYLNEADNWQPNLDDIASKINNRTKGVVLINPNNPTGSNCTRDLLEGLAQLALEHNLVVFADEIYDKLLLDHQRHISIASLNPDLPTVTFSGLSKNFLGPGLRLGWGVVSGPMRVLKNYVAAINKMLRARLCASHPVQYAVKPALEGDQSHLIEVIAKLTRRRDLTVARMNSLPGITCVPPRGAFYAFPRLHITEDDHSFVARMIEETGVVVVPGSGFGQEPGTRHFRIVFLPPEEQLEKAYDRIADFMERNRDKIVG